MPGIVRKLAIFATVNGLVIQSHGSVDHHKAIRIDYKSTRIQDESDDASAKDRKQEHIEAHGLIG